MIKNRVNLILLSILKRTLLIIENFSDFQRTSIIFYTSINYHFSFSLASSYLQGNLYIFSLIFDSSTDTFPANTNGSYRIMHNTNYLNYHLPANYMISSHSIFCIVNPVSLHQYSFHQL